MMRFAGIQMRFWRGVAVGATAVLLAWTLASESAAVAWILVVVALVNLAMGVQYARSADG